MMACAGGRQQRCPDLRDAPSGAKRGTSPIPSSQPEFFAAPEGTFAKVLSVSWDEFRLFGLIGKWARKPENGREVRGLREERTAGGLETVVTGRRARSRGGWRPKVRQE